MVGVGRDPGRRASHQVWPRVCGGLWGAGAEGARQPRAGHGLLPRRLFGVLERPVQSCCFRGHCGCWVQAHWRDLGAGLGGGRDRQGWRWVRARWAPALWGPCSVGPRLGAVGCSIGPAWPLPTCCQGASPWAGSLSADTVQHPWGPRTPSTRWRCGNQWLGPWACGLSHSFLQAWVFWCLCDSVTCPVYRCV